MHLRHAERLARQNASLEPKPRDGSATLCGRAISTLAFGHHEDRTPTHGYEPTREAAMAAFARSWRRE